MIEDFEEKNYQLPRTKPVDVLRFLMEQRELLQKDIVDTFGTPSFVSEVMSGKRGLNKEHIRRLAARFHVSPELFSDATYPKQSDVQEGLIQVGDDVFDVFDAYGEADQAFADADAFLHLFWHRRVGH